MFDTHRRRDIAKARCLHRIIRFLQANQERSCKGVAGAGRIDLDGRSRRDLGLQDRTVGQALKDRGPVAVLGHDDERNMVEGRRQAFPLVVDILQRKHQGVEIGQDLAGGVPLLAVHASPCVPAPHPALWHRRDDALFGEDRRYARLDLVGDWPHQHHARAAQRLGNVRNVDGWRRREAILHAAMRRVNIGKGRGRLRGQYD